MALILNGTTGINNVTWTTATRPTSPATGQTGYNTTLNAYETYNGTGWTVTASWTTANRPVTPSAGYSGYNTTLLAFEFYNGTSWVSINSSYLSYTASYLIVAGWRPFAGWVCGIGLAYVSIIEPIARLVATLVGYTGAFPAIDTTLTMQVLLGMLGMGGLRTLDKIKGVAAK